MTQPVRETGVQFRILGPIEVWTGRVIDLGGLKQRTLMAALLLGAGHVQTVDRLVETLWDDTPPASAHSLVRFYVHQLRKRLGPEGATLLRTAPPGYRLPAEGIRIDLSLFEKLTAEAREAAAIGDYRLAVSRFRAGLALWRGPVLCGTESALLERLYVPRIEEARLTAMEDLVDSELALGDLAGVVGELRTLTGHHPFRERMHHQLMLALYRSGRRVEALEAFWRVRGLLADEMGIDPGPRLQQLMQAILTDQVPPGPAPAATAAAVTVRFDTAAPVSVRTGAESPARIERTRGPEEAETPFAVPSSCAGAPAMQAPSAICALVGRDTERRLVREWFQRPVPGPDGSRVAVISGLPGVGKSALLACCARDLRVHYPDGQLYADLADTPVGDALADLLVALGVPRAELPRGTSQRAGFFRGVTHGRRVLVLLDNVTSEHQARPLVPASPGSAVLLASDRRLATLENVLALDLDVLDVTAGVAMLESLLGSARVVPERRAAEEIVRLCDGLPLAIRIVAARLAVRPDLLLAQAAHRLRDPRRRLDELRTGDLDLRARLSRGFRRLDPQAQRLFRVLGRVPDADLTLDRLASLLDGDPTAGADALVRSHYLVVGAGDSSYRRLGLVGCFAGELSAEAGDLGLTACPTAGCGRRGGTG